MAQTTTTSATSTTPIMATGSTASPYGSATAKVNTTSATGGGGGGGLQQRGGSVNRATPPPPTSSPRGAARGSGGGSGGAASSSTTSTSQLVALVKDHAHWSSLATTKALAANSQVLLRHGPLQCLIAAANAELQRLHDLAEQVKNSHKRSSLFLLKYDPRLMHILVYLVCNDAPKVPIVERILIEQFTVPVIEDETLALQVCE